MSLVQVADVSEAGPPTLQEVGRIAQCQAGEDPWLSPHSCLLVAMAHPKNSQDGHVPAPRLLGTPLMLAFFLGEKTRGFCGFRELKDPILEAGPGPEEGEGGTFKGHKM